MQNGGARVLSVPELEQDRVNSSMIAKQVSCYESLRRICIMHAMHWRRRHTSRAGTIPALDDDGDQ